MLNKVIYRNSTDLYYTNFLSMQQGTLVVPGPEVADLWRTQLFKAQINLKTLTYADWVKELKNKCLEKKFELTSKTELWDAFHDKWHQGKGPNDYLQFQRAFEIFTDVKSYTDDVEIFKQILGIETTLSLSVMGALAELFEDPELMDEYNVLRQITEKLNNNKYFDAGSVHLIGFKVLTTVQLDMLDALSSQQKIHIYLPEYLYLKTKDNKLSDWPMWIREDEKIILENKKIKKENFLILCDKGDYPSIWKQCLGKTVTISEQKLELPLLPYGNQKMANNFRSSTEVSKSGSQIILKKIHEKLIEGKKSWSQVLQIVNKTYDAVLAEKNNYGLLKWTQFIKNWMVQKTAFLKKEQEFSWLDFFILEEKITLDAVRLFWQENDSSSDTITINILQKDIYFYPTKENYLLVDQPFAGNSNADSKYRSESLAILKSLGPMVSDEWHQFYYESVVQDFLGQSEVSYLFIDKELVMLDLFWKNLSLSDNFVLKTVSTYNIKNTSDDTEVRIYKHQIDTSSPSALLTYKNCPRQYYAHYIEKLQLTEEEQAILTESKKGEIYHHLIQKIGHDKELCQKLIQSKEELQNILLTQFEKELIDNEASVEEIAQVVQHTLSYWIAMPLWNNKWKIEWEKPFVVSSMHMKGRMDFAAYNEEKKQLIILDFKKSSVPSAAEVKRFDQWQISCYINGWKYENPQKIVDSIIFGYWNLSDVEDSTIFQVGEVEFSFPIKTTMFKDDFSEWEALFDQHWLSNLEKLKSDENFAPKPKSVQICSYCALNITCTKGSLK